MVSRIFGAAAAFLFLATAARAEDCHIGAYRFADGSVIDVAPSVGDTLRWRNFDGTTGALHPVAGGGWTNTAGWTDRADGTAVSFSDCAKGEMSFAGKTGQRIAFDVTETNFEDRGVKLAGRLVLPKGVGPVPVVVLVHGSEHDSAIHDYALQRLLPAEGVGAFVYDKRGTGGSGGVYTQDFDVLADDAVAAMRQARLLAGARGGRVGYQGGSEGGWVVPLAANRAPVDFAIVSFGLAVTVMEEDAQEVALEMSLKGHSPDEIAKALEVAHAAETMIADSFAGFAAFDAARAKYKGAPWFKDLHGNFTWFVLPLSEDELRAKAKEFDFHTPFRYEPMPALRASTTPQLWILGRDDLDAPSAQTSQRINGLIGEGRDFTLALYPGAEHGMTEYALDAKGERVSTRFAAGYFAMMRDFARDGRLSGTYGKAQIVGVRAPR